MDLKRWIEETKNQVNQGKLLSQVSLENYLTDILRLDVLDTKVTEGDWDHEFEFVATNGTNEYLFDAKFLSFEAFVPNQNVLYLKEIRGKEGVYKTNEAFYVKNIDKNKNHNLLKTALADLLKGVEIDEELSFVVDYFKKKFRNVEGYTYEEKRENNLSSFCITLDDRVVIENGFSNTIQITFKKQKIHFSQFMFRDKDKQQLFEELDALSSFISNYLDWKLWLGRHHISGLFDYLLEKGLTPEINPTAFIQPSEKEGTLIFRPMTIGDYDSYHQIQVSIYYEAKTKEFVLRAQYLFKTFDYRCKNNKEVKEKLGEIIQLIRNEDNVNG